MTSASSLAETRARVRRQRAALGPVRRAENSAAIAKQIAQRPWTVGTRTIAGYDPLGDEVDANAVRRAIEIVVELPLRWLLPRIEGSSLVFADPTLGTRLHRFGMVEPLASPVGIDEIDVVVVPMVGFTETCDRVGMGGGYYDRTFASMRERRHVGRPRLVGVAFDEQLVEIEAQPWDVALDEVITPTRIVIR